MIPVGYMAKRVSPRPEWLAAERVADIYSVSMCISKNFADYIPYWKHNGYWFFDTPEIIEQLAREHAIDLHGTSLFYYEVYEHEFDEDRGVVEGLRACVVPDQRRRSAAEGSRRVRRRQLRAGDQPGVFAVVV